MEKWRARPAKRWPWLLAALTVSCATAASVSIERLGPSAAAPGPAVTAVNVGEQLDRGRFPEVEAYFRSLPPADLARNVSRIVSELVAVTAYAHRERLPEEVPVAEEPSAPRRSRAGLALIGGVVAGVLGTILIVKGAS